MKQITTPPFFKTLTLGAAFFAVSLSAQGISFEKKSFKETLAKAKQENKLVFIDAMASWCGPCKMMERNIFPVAKVGDFYNKNFLNLTLDMEKGEGREVAQRYGIRAYPTFLFLNGDGELVLQNSGYLQEADFLKIGEEAAAAKGSFAEMKKKFLAGDRSPEVLMGVARAFANSEFDLAKQAGTAYFAQKSSDGILTQDEANLLMFFVKNSTDEAYRNFQKFRPQVEKFYDPQMIAGFDRQLKVQDIWNAAQAKDSKTVDEKMFLEKAQPVMGEQEAKRFLALKNLSRFQEQQDWKNFENSALEAYAGEVPDAAGKLAAAEIIAQHSSNPKALAAAALWTEQSLMNGENLSSTWLMARLYSKLGKKNEALMFAGSALQQAKKANQPVGEIETLINSLKK